MRSAYENTEGVTNYLRKAVELGRIVHIKDPHHSLILTAAPLGVKPIARKVEVDSDLSAPADHSVNDGITKELCSLSYVSIDQATTAAG